VTEFVDDAAPLQWPGIDQWVGNQYKSELTSVSWKDVRSLAAAGWEIGSHTCTHPHLTRCADANRARELRESRQRCEEELQSPCRSLAYPYGDWNVRVRHAAAQAGYVGAAALSAWERAPAPARLATYWRLAR
jgi:peptidoglycan/xylan/chitin deacetylase (PgdA/CDA1 family)